MALSDSERISGDVDVLGVVGTSGFDPLACCAGLNHYTFRCNDTLSQSPQEINRVDSNSELEGAWVGTSGELVFLLPPAEVVVHRR